MIDDEQLRELAERLTGVPGVAGVLLGGSRARGEHTPDSDIDLGLYYRHPLDVVALGDLARDVTGDGARVTRPEEWGPWVDGGGWLHIAGTAVDWIYRDLERVHTSWVDARAGRYASTPRSGTRWGCPTSRKAVTRADTTYVAGCLFASSRCAPTLYTGTPGTG